MEDIILLRAMVVDGSLIELVHNLHCEHYEILIDGIPVYNTTQLIHANYEYSMEAAQYTPPTNPLQDTCT